MNNYNGNYQLIAASPYGSVTSSVVNVNYYAPFASPVLQYVTNTVGNYASFNITASGNPLPTYQWLVNGVPIQGATGSGLGFLCTNAGTFNYSVQLQNVIGTATYGIAQLVSTNGTGPQITQQPQSVTNALGSNVTFTVTATGNPTPTYQWRFNGAAITGANGSSYSLSATSGGNFDVVVANYYNSITSSVAVLTITIRRQATLSPATSRLPLKTSAARGPAFCQVLTTPMSGPTSGSTLISTAWITPRYSLT